MQNICYIIKIQSYIIDKLIYTKVEYSSKRGIKNETIYTWFKFIC